MGRCQHAERARVATLRKCWWKMNEFSTEGGVEATHRRGGCEQVSRTRLQLENGQRVRAEDLPGEAVLGGSGGDI